jgi:hypothetical protein
MSKKHLTQRASVAADDEKELDLGVVDMKIKQKRPHGDTSKVDHKLAESISDDARKIAAELLGTTVDKMVPVSHDQEEQVLDTGRELHKEFLDSAAGKWVIRLFRAIGRRFVRIEMNDQNETYTTLGP